MISRSRINYWLIGLNTRFKPNVYYSNIGVYLKRYYLEVSTPQLVEALDFNKIKCIDKSKAFETPKIVIYEKHIGLEPINEATNQSESSNSRSMDVKIKNIQQKVSIFNFH